MTKQRRKYDKEFKQMAVNLCLTGKTCTEVANELGVRVDLVSRWKREYDQHQSGSFSGHGNQNLTPEQREIVRLKKELREARLESEILKKAVSIFSKNDNKSSDS